MAVTTPDEFFAILQKSKLLTPSQLAQARLSARQGDTPTAIAKSLARRELITRWQAGQLLAGRSSFYLGKYRLIELLGRGGMGSVFLGQHVTMNRRVALKIISRRVRKDRASLDRFLAEARAIATLDHPNIVQAYSVDNEGDRYYIVMEYVEGMNLQRLVEEDGPLECRLAADYVRQAAEGLDHAHRRNMIHCDIKPSNLLVNVQGVVKILDMGLARLTGKGVRNRLCEAPGTDQGSVGPFPQTVPDTFSEEPEAGGSGERVLGSVDYLAPEQAIEGPDLDHRADVYSLGCTLYFLLTGHPPFPQGTLTERILKHQTQEPSAIRAERPGVPAELAAICAKMMAKRPENRYQSAAEVGRVLADWRSAASSLKRAVPLVRARPLEESPIEGLPRIRTDDEPRRPPPGKRGSGILAGKPLDATPAASPTAEKLFATPLLILSVVSALLLVLLATVAVVVVVHRWQGDGKKVAAPDNETLTTPSPTPPGDAAKPESPQPMAPPSERAKPEPPLPGSSKPATHPPDPSLPEPSRPGFPSRRGQDPSQRQQKQ
jgi:serine/threonine protein kinase